VETPSNTKQLPVMLHIQFSFLELLKDCLSLKSYFSFRTAAATSATAASSSASTSSNSSFATVEQTEQTILRKEEVDKIVNQHFNDSAVDDNDVTRLSKFFD
jgi:paraquat-inducible protein B